MKKTSPPALFNANRMAALAVRADHIKRDDADFLIRHAGETLADRLEATNREFPICIDLQSPFNLGPATFKRCSNTGKFFQTTWPQSAASASLPADIEVTMEALPFKPASISLITSLFSLHRSNDLPGTLVQIRKALKPDGLFLACLPGEETLKELRHSLIAAESELDGSAAMRVDPFGQVRQYGDLLQRAGFSLPVVDSETLTVRYADMSALIKDLRAMGATASFLDRAPVTNRRLFERAEEIYHGLFSDSDGRIRATVDIVYLSGWSPDPSQQKPLKPGSATNQLKDFL